MNLPNVQAVARNVYELSASEDRADLIICCEVLEHLENPLMAMDVFKTLEGRDYIFSVPREPVWRILNMLRGKYIIDKGNTPGHLNHWSQRAFVHFIQHCGFHVSDICCPLPWIMVKGHF
jgi:2-polyprenyl-3-methyl-5-hydroxy-6-metoxy-1,4-benzoquinol methylase